MPESSRHPDPDPAASTAQGPVSPLEALEAEFERRHARSDLGGGREAIDRQHAKGNLTALERMGLLFDRGSFERHFALRGADNSGDGVVAGVGRVGGRRVRAYGWDFTNYAGTCSADNGRAVREVVDAARAEHCPLVSINDSGGARVQDGVSSLYGYSEVFSAHIDASGVVPQISAIVGPCAGGAVYAPALTDFVIMSTNAFMAVTGPDVMKATTGKSLTKDELGGWRVHSQESGRVNLVGRDDKEVIELIRELLGFLSDSCLHLPPRAPCDDPLDRPTDLSREVMRKVLEQDTPFDVRVIVSDFLDDSRFFEVSDGFAPNLVTGFGRLAGWPVGVLANQSAASAGNLDPDSAKKGTRFVRFCDCFNIPLVTLVDVSGFVPDERAEANDIEGYGAALMMAYRRATVPKFSIVVRRAFGGAFDVMCNKQARTNRAFAWPTARFAVMGAPGAVDLIHRRALKKILDGEGEEAYHVRRNELIDEYKREVVNPWKAAELGYIDQFISIRETRKQLAEALEPLMEVEKLKPRRSKGANWPV